MKKKIIICSLILLFGLGCFSTIRIQSKTKTKETEEKVVTKVINSSKEDYVAFEMMSNHYQNISEMIKLKIENKLAEIKAKEEAERVEKERIEKERVEKERVKNIYDNASSSKSIAFVGLSLPDPNTFGKYQAQAKLIYNAMMNGSTENVSLEGFLNLEECYEFRDLSKNAYGIYPFQYGYTPDGKRTVKYQGSEFKERQNYVRAIKYINANIGSIVPNGVSEVEAVKIISQWIINRNTYTLDVPSAISLLEGGRGNCNAYATTFKLMCNAVGIQSDIVIGNAGGAHGWNRVLLNGSWYYVDLTFADTSDNGQYLLSQALWGDHIFEKIDNYYMYF